MNKITTNTSYDDALKCLEEIGDIAADDFEGFNIKLQDDDDFRESYDIVRHSLLRAKEQEKMIMSFHILKKKKVNIARLLTSRGRNEYNKRLPIDRKLDKSQYSLLKETICKWEEMMILL